MQDIERLWMLGKEYRKHTKRLIEDCDIIPLYIIVKAAKAVRKYIDSLRAQGYNERIQVLERSDDNDPQIMKNTTTMSKKRSASSQKISKNIPAKKQNVANQKKDKIVTPVSGLAPDKTDDGKEKIYMPIIPDHPTIPAMLKQLKAANGLGTEDIKPITRTRNKRQLLMQSDIMDQMFNTNPEEQMVDRTGLGSNEGDILVSPSALPNDFGKNIKPNSSSRLLKELAAYNLPGGNEYEDTSKQTTGRSIRRHPVWKEDV